MKKKEILDAREKLLDAIDTFIKWFLSVAIVIWWAGLPSNAKVIELLGLKVARIKLGKGARPVANCVRFIRRLQ